MPIASWTRLQVRNAKNKQRENNSGHHCISKTKFNTRRGMQCIWRNTVIQARRERFPPAYSASDTTFYLFTNAQAVQFLHSTIPGVACLRLSYASVIYHVIYFQFSIQSAFSNIWLARSHLHCGVLLVLIHYIAYRTLQKFRQVLFLYGTYIPADRLELILLVKNETKHPVEKPEVVSKEVSNAAIFSRIFNHLNNQQVTPTVHHYYLHVFGHQNPRHLFFPDVSYIYR